VHRSSWAGTARAWHLTGLQALALAASVAGIAVSAYLTTVHYAGAPLACPSGGTINCEVVLSSSYGVIAGTGVPTSLAGIVWFGVSAALWTRRLPRAQLAWSAAGTITVLYLVFVEIVLLGTICLWCTAAHVLVVTIFLVTLSRR
jgi:uncharacterized membrane protein